MGSKLPAAHTHPARWPQCPQVHPPFIMDGWPCVWAKTNQGRDTFKHPPQTSALHLEERRVQEMTTWAGGWVRIDKTSALPTGYFYTCSAQLFISISIDCCLAARCQRPIHLWYMQAFWRNLISYSICKTVFFFSSWNILWMRWNKNPKCCDPATTTH